MTLGASASLILGNSDANINPQALQSVQKNSKPQSNLFENTQNLYDSPQQQSDTQLATVTQGDTDSVETLGTMASSSAGVETTGTMASAAGASTAGSSSIICVA